MYKKKPKTRYIQKKNLKNIEKNFHDLYFYISGGSTS